MSSNNETGADIKTRILDVAADAFLERGFADTTIDDIADGVGATKGLIYYHFKSKFDIFLAVYEHGMKRVRALVEPLAALEGTGRQRLIAMSSAHVENLMTGLGYHHAVHQGVRDQSSAALKVRQRDALRALNQLRRDYELMFCSVIVDGVGDGSLKPMDAPFAARLVLSSLNAVDVWYRKIEGQRDVEIRELARTVVDLVIGGLIEGPSSRQ